MKTTLGLSAATLLMGLASAAAQTKVIYSFAGDEDGEYADTDLVIDSGGNLYGSTVQGGDFSSGTVFELSSGDTGWMHTVLYSFTGAADGGEPYKGVTLGPDGNLFGTAGVGGLYTGPCVDTGCGVVFKLIKNGGIWTQKVIHSFTGSNGDGYGPGAGVTVDRNGNVYGTTPTGGTYGYGIVYELQPDGRGNWTERVIHTFTGGNDGIGGSAGRLVMDAAGNLYGTCTTGGANGAGVVYALAPTGAGEWTESILYTFKDEPNSGFPYGALVADAKGNLYGTTYYAGKYDVGTAFRLSRRNGVWVQTWLYSFKGGANGSAPISTLAADAADNVYGTTSEGGAPACACGGVFKLTLSNNAAPVYSVVYRFTGPPDGAFVYNGLVANQTGTVLYGATVHGGVANEGSIYQLTP